MIRFYLSRGHRYTLSQVRRSRLAPAVSLVEYDALFRSAWVRRGQHVFTDLDRLSYWDLELAAEIYGHLKQAGVPVMNNPALHKSRHSLLRALRVAGLNDFDAYRVNEIDAIRQFPVFVRKMQGHRHPLSGLLQTRDDVRKAVADAIAAGVPEENLIIIECVAEAVREGPPPLYRKLAAFRIGDAIVPHQAVHDTTWLVKYGQKFEDIEDLYQAEQKEMEENPWAEHLRKVFDVAGIEYGRADFAFWKGRLQVFEINTNPTVTPPTKHPSATRYASVQWGWEQYMKALHRIDSPQGGMVRVPNGKLQRGRAWKNMFVRTRKVH